MKIQPHLYMNGSRHPGILLDVVTIGCNTAFPDAEHCEFHWKFPTEIKGNFQWNMHKFSIRACCHCAHRIQEMSQQNWKEIADAVGYNYARAEESPIPKEVKTFVNRLSGEIIKRPKRCKMCKDEDAEIGNYCEACHSFRLRNGLAL